MNRLRAVGIVEAAVGSVVLARAELLLQAVDRVPPATVVVGAARLLGARMLAQGGLTVVAPSRRAGLGGAATDLAHAASMAPVIRWSPTHRRAALASAAVALGLAGGQALAMRGEKTRP